MRDVFDVADLARRDGVSRKTAYKWIARYDTAGPAGLVDQSRRPAHSPQATAPTIIAALLTLRGRHPLPLAQRRVLTALAQCRTAALGGPVEPCDRCAHTRVWYNSRRNRHCPTCQSRSSQAR